MSGSRLSAIIFCAGILLISVIYWPFGMDANLGIRQVLLGMLLFAIFSWKSFKREQIFQPDKATWFYLAFVTLCLLSGTWAICAAESFETSSRFGAGFLVFVLSRQLCNSEPAFEKFLCLTALVLAGLTATIGICQIIMLPGLDKEYLYAVTGLNAHKNLFSSFIFLLLFFVYRSLRHFQKYRILISIIIAFNVLLMLLLQSRATILAILLLLVLISITRFKKISNTRPALVAIGFFALALFVMTVVLPFFLQQIVPSTSSISDTEERLLLWKKTYSIMNSHWLFGMGAGNWQVYFPSAGLDGMWRVEDLNVTFQRPHNDLLWIFSETGIAGLILFLALCGTVLHRALKADSFYHQLAGIWIVCFLLIAFFDFPFERTEHILLFNLILAVPFTNRQEGAALSSRGYCLIASVFAACMSLVFIMRLQGETFAQKIQIARSAGLAQSMAVHVAKAENVFYRLDPFSMPLAWYAANAHLAMGDTLTAAGDFQRAQKYGPWNRNVLNDYASLCVLQGNKPLAKSIYKQIMLLSPRFDDAKLNLSAVYLNEDSLDAAENTLKSLLHDSERRSNYLKILEVKRMMGTGHSNKEN